MRNNSNSYGGNETRLPSVNRCWVVRGAEAYRAFVDEEEARAFAGEWGKIIPMVEDISEAQEPQWQVDDRRIKALMEQCGMPNSMSVYLAMKQLVTETELYLEQKNGWRPISTVPKDGTVVDLCSGSWGKRIANCRFRYGAWEVGDVYQEYAFDPTHWMPLPYPPK